MPDTRRTRSNFSAACLSISGNRWPGEHVACPVCGPNPPKTIATDAFEAQYAMLSVVDQVPAEILAQLREAGALEETGAAVLGSVVGTVETFLEQTFLARVTGGAALTAGEGNIFQRLAAAVP